MSVSAASSDGNWRRVCTRKRGEDSRPDLGSRLGDDGEASRVIVEANPGDLLERIEGADELVERANVLQFRLEPHGGQDWGGATTRVVAQVRGWLVVVVPGHFTRRDALGKRGEADQSGRSIWMENIVRNTEYLKQLR